MNSNLFSLFILIPPTFAAALIIQSGLTSLICFFVELKSKVQVIFDANPDIEVVIQSDASTPFDFVAKALASIQAIGVESVGIITTGYES